MRSAKQLRLIAELEPVAEGHGLELVDVILGSVGDPRLVRVYLDKPGGLTIDDLAAANSWVDVVIESIEPYKGAYVLEVSSPGIDRPLRTRQHFERFVGEAAKITTERIGKRHSWTGVLAGVDGDDVLLEIDGERHRLPFDSIKKAHVKGRVEF